MFVINDLKNTEFMEEMTITRKENSLIEIAHKEIIVPEKRSLSWMILMRKRRKS